MTPEQRDAIIDATALVCAKIAGTLPAEIALWTDTARDAYAKGRADAAAAIRSEFKRT